MFRYEKCIRHLYSRTSSKPKSNSGLQVFAFWRCPYCRGVHIREEGVQGWSRASKNCTFFCCGSFYPGIVWILLPWEPRELPVKERCPYYWGRNSVNFAAWFSDGPRSLAQTLSPFFWCPLFDHDGLFLTSSDWLNISTNQSKFSPILKND